MTYQQKQYSIPLNIILPIGFPGIGPKVYLSYKLDKESAKNNPLIVGESEIMNNYIHKWQGNNSTYTLGGLCYNLTKSFEMHPPLGEAPKTESKSMLSSLGSMANSMVDGLKTQVSKATNGRVFKQKEESEADSKLIVN
jgi:hypothetical protein